MEAQIVQLLIDDRVLLWVHPPANACVVGLLNFRAVAPARNLDHRHGVRAASSDSTDEVIDTPRVIAVLVTVMARKGSELDQLSDLETLDPILLSLLLGHSLLLIDLVAPTLHLALLRARKSIQGIEHLS